ncbi:hypothetical protein BDB01DRAFT_803333 [Pilobolus umbonatus]|nr:hypothetical protein BDB01DRAFT_803333 [Pilobolus umbonatus]
MSDEEQCTDYTRLVTKKGLKKGTKETDRLEECRQVWYDCISDKGHVPRTVSYGTLEENGWTTIRVNKGPHLHTMGFSHEGKITLYLEEAAYLVSRNALVVVDTQDRPVPFQHYCRLLCEEDRYDHYQVYVYLKKLGYTVTKVDTRTDNMSLLPLKSVSVYQQWCQWLYPYRRPLTWDYRYSTYKSVYSALQIIPYLPWHQPSPMYSLDWNVYKPTTKWKKKDPCIPDFMVKVVNVLDPFPTPQDYHTLFTYSQHIVLGLVEDTEGVLFMSLTHTVPEMVDHKKSITKRSHFIGSNPIRTS